MKIAYCPHCRNPIIVADRDWGKPVQCDAPRCERFFPTGNAAQTSRVEIANRPAPPRPSPTSPARSPTARVTARRNFRWGWKARALLFGLALVGLIGWRGFAQDDLLVKVDDRLARSSGLLRGEDPEAASSHLGEAEECLSRLDGVLWLPLWQERRSELDQRARVQRRSLEEMRRQLELLSVWDSRLTEASEQVRGASLGQAEETLQGVEAGLQKATTWNTLPALHNRLARAREQACGLREKVNEVVRVDRALPVWARHLKEVGRSLNDGKLDDAARTLGQVEAGLASARQRELPASLSARLARALQQAGRCREQVRDARLVDGELTAWSKQLDEVVRSLDDGSFAAVDRLLGKVEADLLRAASWAPVPPHRLRLGKVRQQTEAARKQVNEARRQDRLLVEWAGRLVGVNRSLKSGQFDEAARRLAQVEAGLPMARDWKLLPTLRARLDRVEHQTKARREQVTEARRLERLLAEWAGRLDEGARSLKEGKLREAGRLLRQSEKDLNTVTNCRDLPTLQTRLKQLQERVKAQRQELADRRYTASIRSLLDEVQPHLKDGEFDRALRILREAASGKFKGDPVVESLARFVKRRRLDPRNWGMRDTRRTEGMVRESVVWKSIRSENTTARYKKFLKSHPRSPFASEASSRLVDLEVAEIAKGAHGTLPPTTEKEKVAGRTYSVVNVHNDTAYTLTLRYSGPDSFMVVFAPQEKGSIEVRVGTYKIAASVDAANVRNYLGSEKPSGGNGEVTYYIKSPLAPIRLPKLVMPGEVRKFEPWKSKRKLPAYLK